MKQKSNCHKQHSSTIKENQRFAISKSTLLCRYSDKGADQIVQDNMGSKAAWQTGIPQ